MKRFGIALAVADMFMFSACEKDSGSEVGKWFGYNIKGDKSDVALVLDMGADGSVDFIITAWGVRMLGEYTYDGKVVTIHVKQYKVRPNAESLAGVGKDPCAPKNIYEWWNDAPVGSEGYEDASSYTDDGVFQLNFTFKGNTGEMQAFNKPYWSERQ